MATKAGTLQFQKNINKYWMEGSQKRVRYSHKCDVGRFLFYCNM